MLGGSVKAENGVGFYHSVRWAARKRPNNTFAVCESQRRFFAGRRSRIAVDRHFLVGTSISEEFHWRRFLGGQLTRKRKSTGPLRTPQRRLHTSASVPFLHCKISPGKGETDEYIYTRYLHIHTYCMYILIYRERTRTHTQPLCYTHTHRHA